MEKLNPKIAFTSVISSFRSLTTGNMNPDLSWRIIVVLTVLAGSALAILASFSYQWASTLEEPIIAPSTDRDTISSEEIRGVIDLYTAKQRRYQDLLVKRPVAPALGGDAGIDLKAIDTARNEVLNVGNEALPSSVVPN